MSSYAIYIESVSEGHPDKVSDQVSDAILDLYLAKDPNARVAVETLVRPVWQLWLVKSPPQRRDAWGDETPSERDLRYWLRQFGRCFDGNTCAVINAIGLQSADIAWERTRPMRPIRAQVTKVSCLATQLTNRYINASADLLLASLG